MKLLSPWLETVVDTKRFPVLQKNITADVAILGGGVAGIMTAFHLAGMGKSVVILEKNHIATGDSGLTTGFLTRVPDTGLAQLHEKYGADFLRKLFTAAAKQQQWFFDLIREQKIDCEFLPVRAYYGSYTSADPVLLDDWKAVENNDPKTTLVSKLGTDFPFEQAIEFQGEGQFHIRKFLFALLEKMTAGNVSVFEESEVTGIEVGTTVKLTTPEGSVTADKLVVTTGKPHPFFNETHTIIEERLTHVIAVRFEHLPISKNLFWDTFNPYFYYRPIDDHTVILGGCDHAPSEREKGQTWAETLTRFSQQHFGAEGKVTNQWSGSLFETSDGLPYVFEHPYYQAKVYICTGFGGNGLIYGGALSSAIAAGLVVGQPHPATELFALNRTGAVIPKPLPKKTAPTAPASRAFLKVLKTSDFNTKKVVCKEINGNTIAVFKADDRYFALSNECSHAGGSLCDGTFDGKTVECPLHASRFDVATGAVVNPPATRPQATFPTKVSGDDIEVELPVADASHPPVKAKIPPPFAGARRDWKKLLVFGMLAALFWLLQFFYQYYVLVPGETTIAMLRSFALSGATLIGTALFSSAVFKWKPKYAKYWVWRRALGVTGFFFIIGHVLSVYAFLFQWNVAAVYFSFNPFENPIIFGSFAFPIFFAMAFTSFDWAVAKLTPRVWKTIHRFVYLGYISAIFHFLLVNPPLLKNPAGYLLLLITFLAVFGQLFWFFKTAAKVKFRSRGTVVGFALILLALVLMYLTYVNVFAA